MINRTRRAAFPAALLFLFTALILAACGASGNARKETAASSVIGNAGNPQDSPAEAAPSVRFSAEAGAYPQMSMELVLETDGACEIYYTTDGSVPTEDSFRYTGPILLTHEANTGKSLTDHAGRMYPGTRTLFAAPGLPRANVIRARAFLPDGTGGRTGTRTYFLGQDLAADYGGAPVLSIVTDPANLLDEETGILVRGRVYEEWKETASAQSLIAAGETWHYEGNYSQKGRAWERPASLELFDGTNSLTIAEGCGLRVHGRASRELAQRSFSLFFRKEYGAESLEHPIFPDAVGEDGTVIPSYRSLILRNGGNDAEQLKFKDRMLQELLADRACAVQEGRLAFLFLNGEYWGHYVLQEKYNDRYFADHYGVPAEQVVVINEEEVDEGREEDLLLYRELMTFAEKDLRDPVIWEQFTALVDADSMLDYFAAEVYIANRDWRPDKNYRLWRTRTPSFESPYDDGRWRFALFDLELSSSMYGYPETASDFDSAAYAQELFPLFRAAMKNEGFRRRFADTVRSLGEGKLSGENVRAALTRYADAWKRYMPAYYARFGNSSFYWDMSLESTAGFFDERLPLIMSRLRDQREGESR